MGFPISKLRKLPKVILALKVKERFGQWSGSIPSADSVTKSTKRKSIRGVPVVEEFPKIFVNDLAKLPPIRESEFTINLELRVTPVHKALYRMALAELKELKMQLLELLDKRFIRPSSSPEGALVLFVKNEGIL